MSVEVRLTTKPFPIMIAYLEVMDTKSLKS